MVDAGVLTPDWRSAFLGLATLHVFVTGLAMIVKDRSFSGDAWLGSFLIALAGVLVPYVAGYMGAYDRWPELTFMPVALPLVLGPCLYVYIRLSLAIPTSRRGLHFVLPALQFVYFLCAFWLPSEAKWDWYVSGHRHAVIPAFEVLTAASLAIYGLGIGRVLRLEDVGLPAGRRLWFRRLQTTLFGLLIARSGYDLIDALLGPLGYEPEFWLYLFLALTGLGIATEGWRQVGRPNRHSRRARKGGEAKEDPAAQAQAYAVRIKQAGWWRDPEMTAPKLARNLGVSETRLSRAFNGGLGISVARFLSEVRAEAVADALERGADEELLQLGLSCGFASKATFNRAFAARFGCSPSAFRRQVSDSGNRHSEAKSRRG